MSKRGEYKMMGYNVCKEIDGDDVCIIEYRTKKQAEAMAKKHKDKGYFVKRTMKLHKSKDLGIDIDKK